MAITKSNFIVVYELGNLDSADFAAYYAAKHDMDTLQNNPSTDTGKIGGIEWQLHGQLLGIQLTDNSEVLSSEADFNIQLLNPINDAIQNSSIVSADIWGIVLGYKIPGGFIDGNDIISATSRLSRLNFTYSKKTNNKLYNRSVFQRFTSTDAEKVLICSRIDAPNLHAAKSYVDNANVVNDQLFANGMFYIDPYSDRANIGAEDYQDLLLEFQDNLLSTLNLESWSTSFIDPYIDVAIPYVENDSFVWSWFTNRTTSSYFRISDALRVFLYNADYDGGLTVRDENGKRWPHLALSAGYSATAGAMSNPTISGFLNPNAFFNALLRGATIGEAYLFSVPHLDWTMTLFGDPLVYCSFPASETPDEDLIDQHKVWFSMSKDLARVASQLFKKEKELKQVVSLIIDLTLNTPLDSSIFRDLPIFLLYPANDWFINNNDKSWQSHIKPLIDTFFDFPRLNYQNYGNSTPAPDINEYLTDQGFKVSSILSGITGGGIIEDANLFDEGWWQFEFIVQDDDNDNFINYHFLLDVSDDSDFDNIVLSKDSYTIKNWTYEKRKDLFVPITFSGVSTSYVGRKVRYESRIDDLLGINEYLRSGQVYYFRVIQYDIETSQQYGPTIYDDIIWT